MIFEEIKNIESSNKKLKEFGLLIGTILLVISAALFYFRTDSNYVWFGGIGTLLILLGLVLPKALLPFQKLWMAFSVILGYFSTRIILAILFYFVFTPMGIFAKLIGKDFLDLKIDKKKESYWQKREDVQYNKEETERQF